MNRVNLELLDKQSSVLDEKQEYLKQYRLDEKSIREFRNGIKKVSQEEANRLGGELYEFMRDSWYYDGLNTEFNSEINKQYVLSLIMNGADVNYMDTDHISTLRYASWCLEYSILLIKAGANINNRDKYGYTLLHIAAKNNYYVLLRIIISLGTDIELKTYAGKDALYYARKYEYKESTKILETFMQGKNIIVEEDIKHNKKSPKALSELTPEELLQEAEDKLNEITSKPLTRKRRR